MPRRLTKPAHKPVRGFLRGLVHLHWAFSRARDHANYPTDQLGIVTREGDCTLVLWHREGHQVLTRYRAKPEAFTRSHSHAPERLAFVLLQEL